MAFDLNDYEPVENRIRAFWEKYPNGRIHTELVHFDTGNFIIKALIYRDENDTVPATTDYAHEVIGSSPVNKNFALSNGCTSAIGRALADLNFAPKGARPSREEMAKVEAVKKANPLDWGKEAPQQLKDNPANWESWGNEASFDPFEQNPSHEKPRDINVISEKQIKFIAQLLKAQGIEPLNQFKIIGEMVKREIRSLANLSKGEASLVIHNLQEQARNG